MKRISASVILVASIATAGYAFAQDNNQADANQTSVEVPAKDSKNFKRAPIDLEKFSKMDRLKAADTNGDGTLSRDEIENMVMKRMIERMANRMEKRLDINGDGKVTLEEIQKQKAKQFAVLDRNDDGQLDRKELRTTHHGHHGKRGWHGKHSKASGWHHKASQQKPAQ
ncbi:MAG: calcium-binding protein [Mesorhizobium sp.]